MNKEHIHDVVTLHKEAYAGFTNVLFGDKYLFNFMEWFASNDHCISLVSLNDKLEPTGYVVGLPLSEREALKKRQLKWASIGLLRRPYLILHPTLVKKVFAFAKSKVFPIPTIRLEPRAGIVGLVSIAVSPSEQGTGVGKHLLASFEINAKQKRFDMMRLYVDSNNARARNAYISMNWTLLETDVESGSIMFTKKLK